MKIWMNSVRYFRIVSGRRFQCTYFLIVKELDVRIVRRVSHIISH
jgi:hypothetical protein